MKTKATGEEGGGGRTERVFCVWVSWDGKCAGARRCCRKVVHMLHKEEDKGARSRSDVG